MRKADLQQQAIELIKQLSTENLQAGVDYLAYLKDKEGRAAAHHLASDQEVAKSLGAKPISKNPIVGRIIEAVEKSNDVTLEDAEILLQVIKENQIPVQFDSPLK